MREGFRINISGGRGQEACCAGNNRKADAREGVIWSGKRTIECE